MKECWKSAIISWSYGQDCSGTLIFCSTSKTDDWKNGRWYSTPPVGSADSAPLSVFCQSGDGPAACLELINSGKRPVEVVAAIRIGATRLHDVSPYAACGDILCCMARHCRNVFGERSGFCCVSKVLFLPSPLPHFPSGLKGDEGRGSDQFLHGTHVGRGLFVRAQARHHLKGQGVSAAQFGRTC